MKRSSPNGFTLIELITVIAVILIIAALMIGISSVVNRRGAVSRAQMEMKAIAGACDAYKTDHGLFPQSADTDDLDPRVDVNPSSAKYLKASVYLYSSLTGDFQPAGAPDGKPEDGNKSYLPFSPKQLGRTSSGSGGVGAIRCIQDPFGSAYGYSTAGNQLEAAYLNAVRTDPSAARPSNLKGYNPTFDLWSTGGGMTSAEKAKWVKQGVE